MTDHPPDAPDPKAGDVIAEMTGTIIGELNCDYPMPNRRDVLAMMKPGWQGSIGSEFLTRLTIAGYRIVRDDAAGMVTIPLSDAKGMLRTLQWAALEMPHKAPPGNAAHALAMSNAIAATESVSKGEHDE